MYEPALQPPSQEERCGDRQRNPAKRAKANPQRHQVAAGFVHSIKHRAYQYDAANLVGDERKDRRFERSIGNTGKENSHWRRYRSSRLEKC